ncbi:MAG: SRPBCC domain-containing protein [Candidatus Sulfotelmatobacter sp.]|jgi:uncharacterized protein YndB with AHSA1/START domain
MATLAITPTQDAIVSEIFIAAPAQRIFEALTDPKQVMTWWTSEECRIERFEFEARCGGKWRFQNTKSRLSVNGVSNFHCEGEVIEYDPPRLLAYTWISSWHEDKSRRTVVRYELTQEEGGTQVKVIHSGLAQESVAREGYSGGWPGVLERLKHFTEK